jgi:isoleucyl-tRNA synthetase
MVGWYDSGAASYASLGHPKNSKDTQYWWPADFIVEGRDQISGWFFSLLKTGIVAFDRSPYKTVLMHGFMLDDKGREMHKSHGNFVTSQEVVEKFGRDPFRYYVLQSTIWEDLKFSWDAVKQYSGDLDTFWNTFVFAGTYMNLDRFNPSQWTISKLTRSLRPEDLWLISRTNRTIREVTKAMDDYKVHEAVRKLKSFLIEDLSHTYIRYIRRRTWVEKQTRDKLSAYATLYLALKSALILLAPIAPFLSESIYSHMFRNAEGKNPETVHLLDWPTFDEKWIKDELEEEMSAVQAITSAAALARGGKALKQRQPVRQVIVASDSKVVRKALRTYAALLCEQTNTKSIKTASKSKGLIFEAGSNTTRFAKGEFADGSVYVDLKLTERDLAEGLARDIVRRMQQMRKEMDLKVDSYVEGYVVASPKSLKLLQTRRRYIAHEVRAKQLRLSTDRVLQDNYYSKAWEIDGEKYELGLSAVETKKTLKRG